MRIKSLLLGGLVALAATSSALAQVNTVPQVGVYQGSVTKATYNSVALALPPAASATDIACIAGSATKTIKVLKIEITGSAATLVTAPFTLVRRTSVDTGGTAATTTANWANNISKSDTNDPAASATLISYSANPTINDTSPTYIRSSHLTVPVTSAGTVTRPLVWDFGANLAQQARGLTLRGAAAQLCVNLNAVSIATGLLHLSITWTEE